MCYREEAIECVKDHVLPLHKQIYAKYEGDFDRTGRVLVRGVKDKGDIKITPATAILVQGINNYFIFIV